jgi:hypothetical protein
LVDTTYDFKPSKLSAEQQSAKSAAMDVVWEKVKADQKTLLPCLKSALNSPTADPFFRFDGGTLLLSLDQSSESKQLLIKSYAGADLDDIVLRNWIAPILQFGLDGFDTSAAGEAWLNARDPKYYLPQHGTLPVDKTIGALAIYGSMDEKFATPALAKIANGEDTEKREIAVRLLLKQATPEAFRELRILKREGLSPVTKSEVDKVLTKPDLLKPRQGMARITREQYLDAFKRMANGDPEQFVKLSVQVPDGEKDAVAVLKSEDVPLVRKARRFMASTGTPHSPEWYASFTEILMALVWEPEVAATMD